MDNSFNINNYLIKEAWTLSRYFLGFLILVYYFNKPDLKSQLPNSIEKGKRYVAKWLGNPMGGRCVSILLLSKRVHFGIYCRPSNFLRQCSFKTDLNLCHISTRVSFRFVACSAIVFCHFFQPKNGTHLHYPKEVREVATTQKILRDKIKGAIIVRLVEMKMNSQTIFTSDWDYLLLNKFTCHKIQYAIYKQII